MIAAIAAVIALAAIILVALIIFYLERDDSSF